MTIAAICLRTRTHTTTRSANILACWGLLLLGITQSAGAMAGLAASVSLAPGAPTSVLPGEISTLEITLSNNSNATDLVSVMFANSLPGALPNGLKVAGPTSYTCFNPATSTTSAGLGTFTAAIGSQVISLAGGEIPHRDVGSSTDGSCTILIPVTPGTSNGAATNYTYTIASGAVEGDDNGSPVSNIGSVSQSINVTALSQPRISKSFNNSTVILGGAVRTLTITVSNLNPVSLGKFSITDNFPSVGAGGPIIQVANPLSVTTTCPGAGFNGMAPGDTSVTVSGGTLAASSSCNIVLGVSARHTNGNYQVSATNTINAVTNFSNDVGIRAQANASATIRARSPLSVSKSFSSGSLAQGQSGTMSITLRNRGDSDLTLQSLTDSPIDGIGDPAPGLGLKVNGAVTVSCTGSGSAGTFVAIDSNTGITQTANTIIGAGQNCTITTPIVGQTMAANTPISYTNSIPKGEANVGNSAIISQPVSASILVADNLRVLKTLNTSNPRPGNPVNYTITVQNWSAGNLSDVRIQDQLPTGITFLTGDINGNDFTPVITGAGCSNLLVNSSTGAGTAEFVIGTLPQRVNSSTPGACNINFYAMTAPNASAGAATTNTLGTGSVCTENGNPAGFCNGGGASSGNSPVVLDPLTAAKSFSPAGPLPEGTVTRMRIALSNFSVNPLTGLSISDTLPIAGGVQMNVASPANAATTCGAGTITAVPGSTSVTLNNGSIVGRANLGAGVAGTCLLELDVVGAAGTYTNTATASATETYANGITHTVDPVQASANFTYNSVLSSAKSFSPNIVSSGGRSTVTISLTNSGPLALTNIAVTDPLPTLSGNTLVLASPTNAYTTCAGATSISGAPGAASLSMTGATVSAGGHCELLFDVVANGTSDWVNTIPPGGIEAVGMGVINQTPVSATLNYLAGTALTVAKANNPGTLTFPGQSSRLTITITNGNEAVTNLEVTDYFTVDGSVGGAPNGMALTSTPATSTTCPGGVVTATPAGGSVILSGASLAANASCTVSTNVTATVTGGITNVIPVGAIATDEGLTNEGQATTSLTTQTNIGLGKQFTPDIIKQGERSRLRIIFYNATPRVATDLSIIDTMPTGVEIAPGPNPSSNCTGASITVPAPNQLELSGGVLAAANGTEPATCYVEIDVTAASPGTYVNQIPAGALSSLIGGIPTSNAQPVSASLRVGQPLVVHKAIGGFTLDAGNPAGFTTGSANRAPGIGARLVINLINPNPTPLTELSIVDVFPPGLSINTTPAESTTCSGGQVTVKALPAATSIALTGATIAASSSCTLSVDILSNNPGNYVNDIPSGSVSTLEGFSNTDGSSAELVVAFPPVIGKQFSPAVIPPNGRSTLTLVFGNDNATSITLSANFTDSLPTLPGPVLVAAIPNVNSSCAGTVTAVAGSNSIRLNSGATIPAGGCSISVDVTGATPGIHTNNIPAGALVTTAGNNQGPANADLLVSTAGFISGTVFQDNKLVPNGSYDLGLDGPIAGVSIDLHAGANCSGSPSQTTTTDAQGNYLFHSLGAGAWSVCQPGQPAGTTNGISTAGAILPVLGSTGSAGTASNPSASTSQVVNVMLNGDGASGAISGAPGNDFAEVVPSTISGQVFLDIDNNGVRNGAEPGIGLQALELLDSGNTVVANTTTDSDGQYSFPNLQPGSYSVRQTNQPAGTSSGITTPGTVDNGGSSGTATTPTATPSLISSIVLPPNTAAAANNFGEIPNGRSINGTVFLDFDNSATLDGPDYGVGGQIIELIGVDVNGIAVPPRQATTHADGSYSFTGLPAGTYTVTQPNQPASTSNGATIAGSTGGSASGTATVPSTITGIDLTGSNTVSAVNNFAEIPDPAPDLIVSKTHAPTSFGVGSSSAYFTITPANIGSVDTSGAITVTDTLPGGMTLAAAASGTDWNCSGVVGGSSVSCSSSAVIVAGGSGNPIIVPIAVSPTVTASFLTNTANVAGGGEPLAFNGNNTDQDTVGFNGTARISGIAWADANLDNILDTDEKRLSSWRVQLLLNNVPVLDTTTSGDGSYSFDQLSPGSGYQIVFRDPVNGDSWMPVTNEQGVVPNPGVRDNPSAAVVVNTGNPAGAVITASSLDNLELFAGDDIIQQSLPVDPDLIPVALSVPVLPTWALLALAILAGGIGGVASRREYISVSRQH